MSLAISEKTGFFGTAAFGAALVGLSMMLSQPHLLSEAYKSGMRYCAEDCYQLRAIVSTSDIGSLRKHVRKSLLPTGIHIRGKRS